MLDQKFKQFLAWSLKRDNGAFENVKICVQDFSIWVQNFLSNMTCAGNCLITFKSEKSILTGLVSSSTSSIPVLLYPNGRADLDSWGSIHGGISNASIAILICDPMKDSEGEINSFWFCCLTVDFKSVSILKSSTWPWFFSSVLITST